MRQVASARILDLRQIPTGSRLLFGAFYATATVLAAYMGLLMAEGVIVTSEGTAQVMGVATAGAGWVMALALAGWRQIRGTPQDRTGPPRQRDQVARERAAAIADRLGIRRPEIRITSGFEGRWAYVCGLRAPYCLVLESLLTREAIADPQKFQAIVAHELSHVANGDARRLALSRALATVVTALLIAAVGIPALKFVTDPVADVSRVLEVDPVPLAWMTERGARFGNRFLLPAVVTVVLFRLAYARLMRRQELLADWRAAMTGFGASLLAAAAADAQAARPWYHRILAGFDVFPTAAHRARMLADPSRMNRTAWVDHVIAGVGCAFAADAFVDLKVAASLSEVPPSDLSLQSMVEFLRGLAASDLVPLLPMLCLLVLWILVFGIAYLRDATAAESSQVSSAWVAVRAASLFSAGSIAGNVFWPGNLREPGFFFLGPGYRITDALGLTSESLTNIAVMWAGWVFTLTVAGLLWRWRVRRIGFDPGLLGAVEMLLLAYFAPNAGMAGLFTLSTGDSARDRLTAWGVMSLGLLISCGIIAAHVLIRRAGPSPFLRYEQAAVSGPPGYVGVIRAGRSRLMIRRWFASLAAISVVLLACGLGSFELEQRVFIITADGENGGRAPSHEELAAFRDALRQRIRLANLVWSDPQIIDGIGEAGLLDRLAIKLDRRSPPRRVLLRMSAAILGTSALSQVTRESAGTVTVRLGSNPVSQSTANQVVGDVLKATFPYLELMAMIREGAPEASLFEFEGLVRPLPDGESNKVNVAFVLATFTERFDLNRARQVYEWVISQRPDYAAAYSNLARVELTLGNIGAAIRDHRIAIRLAPYEPLPYFEMAVALRIKSRSESDRSVKADLQHESCRHLALSRRLGFDQVPRFTGCEDDDPRPACDQAADAERRLPL